VLVETGQHVAHAHVAERTPGQVGEQDRSLRRQAVDAPVLATAVRVDPDVEADVRALVLRERAARGVGDELGARIRGLVVREAGLGVGLEARDLEAVRGCRVSR
jgi:hypothetical protein